MGKRTFVDIKEIASFNSLYNAWRLCSIGDGKDKRRDVIDFEKEEKSNVRNCDFYCRMQLRISGVLCVTWHSSEVLTNFLEDCREHQQDTGEVVFPIECCMFSVGDDRAYYLIDAPDDAFVPTERELEKMFDKARRNKR